MSRLRGYLALLIVCLGLILSDPIQRLIIAPWVKLRPSSRIPVLGRWINAMAVLVVSPLVRIGGASIQLPERRVPCGPGTLILMNHQSVLDIPLVVKSVDGGYPRIVTRARYNRFIPLISHMVRLYQYPVVDPEANPREVLKSARAMAREAAASDVPMAVFPEGTRTRDGKIGSFRRRGLARILGTRAWTVHVLVVDGYWKTARFADFFAGLSHLDGRITHAGTLSWDDPRADPEPFMDQVHQTMSDALADMRSGARTGA